jgi:hypothetical protein
MINSMGATANVQVQIKKTVSNTVLSRRLPLNKEVHYTIYNSSKKTLYSKTIMLVNAPENVLEDLDLSHLPAGNYTLCITAGSTNKILEQINITL